MTVKYVSLRHLTDVLQSSVTGLGTSKHPTNEVRRNVTHTYILSLNWLFSNSIFSVSTVRQSRAESKSRYHMNIVGVYRVGQRASPGVI